MVPALKTSSAKSLINTTFANNAGKINKLVMVFAFRSCSHDSFLSGDKSGPHQYC